MKKKVLALLITCCLSAALLQGCADKEQTTAGSGNGSFEYLQLANTVEDSSDLPDWEGKQLKLQMWYAGGTGNPYISKRATNDVVTPEMARVTGVQYDLETSFDNGGESMDAKLGKIAVSKDYPDVIVHGENAILNQLIDAGKIYDLTDLIPEYCPNIYAMLQKEGLTDGLKSKRDDGRIYTLEYNILPEALKYTNPEIDAKTASRLVAPKDPIGYVMVRDDILKMIYPEAKTQDEIEQMYMEKGEFTKEEILDVTFNSVEEFFEFLQKVKDLGLKEGNKDVAAFYTHNGADNWNLLTTLGFLYGYNFANSADANYFTYWDKETKQVEYMFKQDFFKEALHDYVKLVQTGVASKEALVDRKTEFEQKVNFGLYAVSYGTYAIDEKALEDSGKDYRYRKVYINIPLNDEKFMFTEGSPFGVNVAFVKDSLSEEDLKQALAFYDFCFTEAGKKLTVWGPRSAGLWTEEDGKRKFVDQELEDCMVNDVANDKDIYYGINGKAWPSYPHIAANQYHPKLIYDEVRQPKLANRYFSMGMLEQQELTTAIAPNIWEFDSRGVEGVSRFWQSRAAFEDALTKVFIAQDDAEFEKLYNDMVSLAEKNGLDDATLEEINRVYAEDVNAEFMDNLK